MYGKIFDSIYDGTLRAHWQGLVTFQQLIILADKDGIIDMTPHAIHGRTGIPLEIIESGLDHLSKPDPYSRSSAEEGRRIVLLDEHRPWGWRLVNHDYYNKLRSAEEKRIADRDRISEKRKSIKSEVSRDVAECSRQSHEVADVAPVAVTVSTTTETKPLSGDARPQSDVQTVFQHWQQKLNHPQSRLSPERRHKISTMLKYYSSASLCKAIDGCAVTPHNMGQNDRGEVYDDICLILRNIGQVERFMRNADAPPKINGGNHATRQPIDKPSLAERASDARRKFEQQEDAKRSSGS